MILDRFFGRIGRAPKPEEEEMILWKADQSGLEDWTGEQAGADGRFNIPVSPGELPGHGKILAVQGSTGGDGATTVAANLAGVLALSSPERVVLADLGGYGTVRSRMGLPAGECLVNILDWEDIHGPGDMARGLFNHSSGIMVVPGVVHYDDVEKVNPGLVFKMAALLKESHDYIILDCPPAGVNNNTWAAALVADAVLTVFKPDRASLDLLEENNGFMIRLGCQKRVYPVLNQAGMPGGIRPGDLEGRMRKIFPGILPYSAAVSESNNRRQLVVHARHKDDFSRAMHLLADSIFI